MAVADPVSKHLTCCICLEVFQVPKTLPCLHTFCETCLDGHICGTKLGRSDGAQYFECPLCRAKTYPINESSKNQWAKSFPTNHAIVALLDDTAVTLRKSIKKGAKRVLECKPCKEDNEIKTAHCFCIHCVEYLCKHCYEDHRKFKTTRDHAVLMGDELPKDIVAFERMSSLKFCNIHTDKEIEFQCKDHSMYLCSICAMTTHRKCESITHLCSINMETASSLQESLAETMALKNDVEHNIHLKLNEADRLDKKSKQAGKEIIEIVKQLDALSNKITQVFLPQHTEKVESEKKKLTTSIHESFERISLVDELSEFANSVSKYGSDKQKILFCDILREQNENMRSSITLHDKCSISLVDEFIKMEEDGFEHIIQENIPGKIKGLLINKSAGEQFSQPVPKLACKVPVTDTSDKSNRPSSSCKANASSTVEAANKISLNETPTSSSPITGRSLITMEVNKIAAHSLSVPAKSSSRCSHSGSVLLSSGNMVFIDRNNKLVKVISPAFRLECYKTLDDIPVDICSRGKDTVFVAMANAILQLKIAEKPQIDTIVKKRGICSICLVGSNLFNLYKMPADANETCHVEVRNMTFEPTNTIDEFRTHFGKYLTFKATRQIRCRNEGNVLVCSSKKIQSLDVHAVGDWSENWYFQLPSADYVASDTKGNIYLCDTVSEVIYQISAKNYKKCRVLIRDIRMPASILFNGINNTFIIGCLDDNKVHVYQLQ